MNTITTVLVVAAAAGSAIVGGIFFAFSNFVMGALARIPPPEGIRAMQSINVVVLNGGFLSVFAGTALLFLVLGTLGVLQWNSGHGPYLLGASVAYLVGTWLLTIAGNVPLNDHLARQAPETEAAEQAWQQYLERWTRLNSRRTGAAILASLLLLLALVL
ncbi:MAG: DUF1772 domain-containing protein [Gammaproteobacteria bacterium]|jgi:uncharacterized membrane protein|nr:DUF1772 domain-containing protein [Gammaproteobacteria bacterium]